MRHRLLTAINHKRSSTGFWAEEFPVLYRQLVEHGVEASVTAARAVAYLWTFEVWRAAGKRTASSMGFLPMSSCRAILTALRALAPATLNDRTKASVTARFGTYRPPRSPRTHRSGAEAKPALPRAERAQVQPVCEAIQVIILQNKPLAAADDGRLACCLPAAELLGSASMMSSIVLELCYTDENSG